MIRAEVLTDDDQFSAAFDATPFFECASLEQLLALRDGDWGGDHPADAVALFMLERDAAVADLFRYLALDPVDPEGFPVGFECTVDEGDVEYWLRQNRPGWCERLWPEDPPDVTALDRMILPLCPYRAGAALSLS